MYCNRKRDAVGFDRVGSPWNVDEISNKLGKLAAERDWLVLRCYELERNKENLESLLCELFKERERAVTVTKSVVKKKYKK